MSNIGLEKHLADLLAAVGDTDLKVAVCPVCHCVKPIKHKIDCEFGAIIYNARAIMTILRRTH